MAGSKASINKKRWKLLSEQLRKQHPSCEICNKTEYLQVHHVFITKYTFKSLMRFEECNLIVLCSKCHWLAHKAPIIIMEYMYNNRKEDYNKEKTLLKGAGKI
jgi:5-methylcytosine-specific restriction endonuclease McrA